MLVFTFPISLMMFPILKRSQLLDPWYTEIIPSFVYTGLIVMGLFAYLDDIRMLVISRLAVCPVNLCVHGLDFIKRSG